MRLLLHETPIYPSAEHQCKLSTVLPPLNPLELPLLPSRSFHLLLSPPRRNPDEYLEHPEELAVDSVVNTLPVCLLVEDISPMWTNWRMMLL
jgi:hypothetical protein